MRPCKHSVFCVPCVLGMLGMLVMMGMLFINTWQHTPLILVCEQGAKSVLLLYFVILSINLTKQSYTISDLLHTNQ